MNIPDLIGAFLTNAPAALYQVQRQAKATMLRGRKQPGALSTLSIAASVQPASGRDLLQLPEGRRSIETRVLYTTTALQIGAQDGAFESDKVSIDGRLWEVQQIQSWEASPATDGAYYRCIVQASS